MKKGTIFVLSGPSGSGKSTIREMLMSKGLNYHYSVSDTTRKIRGKEINGVDYNFISKERFEENIKSGRYYEYAQYADCYYGTPKSEVFPYIEAGVNVILEIEAQGAMQVKAQDDTAVLVMLLPPTYAELEYRLRNRQTDSEEKIQKRLAKAKEELTYFDRYEYFLLNENGKQEECVRQLELIAETLKYKTKNNPEFTENFYKNEGEN